MASTAKVLSSPQAQAVQAVQAVRAVPAPAPRRARWGWLQLVRDTFGGALLLVVWLALWTVTWAAVAGPLAPVGEGRAVSAEVRS